MASLTVLDGALKGQRLELTQAVTRIGRREGNDWVLPDPSISGTHCEVEVGENGILIRDLGSTNGTKVNNNPVKEQMIFRNDILMFGDVPLMLEGDDVPEGGKSAPAEIPRTTIVIRQNKKVEPPKEFTKKSNSNRIWIILIVLLLLGIAYPLFLYISSLFTK